MELGTSSTEFYTYASLSVLFSLCIIFPPQEFNASGFTIQKIFAPILGDERFDFVEYHLRRTLLTIFIHVSLPFCNIFIKFSK